MVRYMMFEDSPASIFVNTIRSVYDCTDIIVDGSSGGTKLFEKSRDTVKGKNAILFAYMDFIPNNSNTIGLYEDFCNGLSKFNLQYKIALIPIPCSEFITLSLYDSIAHTGGSVLLWDNKHTYEVSLKITQKHIDCINGKGIASCKFYKTDCLDSNHEIVMLDDKKIRFVETLPVFMASNTKLRYISSSLIGGLKNSIDICTRISDMVGADTEHCREVLNMNPLLHIK